VNLHQARLQELQAVEEVHDFCFGAQRRRGGRAHADLARYLA
jgi:hypothetical protein